MHKAMSDKEDSPTRNTHRSRAYIKKIRDISVRNLGVNLKALENQRQTNPKAVNRNNKDQGKINKMKSSVKQRIGFILKI